MKRTEQILFFVFVILYLLPVLLHAFYPTLDGPSHLYNSGIIDQLLFYPSSAAHDFFMMNPSPEANWSGHFLLALFNLFLPAFLSEKLLLVIYIVGITYSFRYLIRTMSPANNIGSWLIFPFIYSFPFCIGFWNFCLAIPILFLTTAYFIRNENRLNIRHGLILALLFLLLYFSHLMVLLLAFLFLGMMIASNLFSSVTRTGLIRKIIFLIAAGFPAFILSVYFMVKNSGTHDRSVFLETSQLVNWILNINPIITINHEVEQAFTIPIRIAFVAMFMYIIYCRMKNKIFLKKGDVWFLACIFLTILYFVTPDELSSGGFVSIRILLFFFLTLILWFAIQPANKMVVIIFVGICVLPNLLFLRYHYQQASVLCEEVLEITSAADHIEKNSVVLPLNYSDNWLHSNLSDYIGATKQILMLDNYEAAKPHFPTCWKPGMIPYGVIGDFATSNHPCIDVPAYEKVTGKTIDYILKWYYRGDMKDSCSLDLNKFLDREYVSVYCSSGGKVLLFKKRQELH